MTTLTYTLLDGAGAPRSGVTVKATAYDGNRYPAKDAPSVSATTNGSGVASFTLPDATTARGTYYKLTGPGITDEPIVRIRQGVTTTTVAEAQTGAAVAGDYTDGLPTQPKLTTPAVSGTAYPNPVKRDIFVSQGYTPTGAGSVTVALSRDGKAFTTVDVEAYTAAGAATFVTFVLPAGHSFKVTATGATLGATVGF